MLYRKLRNAKLRGKDTTELEKEYNDFLVQYKDGKSSASTSSVPTTKTSTTRVKFDIKKTLDMLFKGLTPYVQKYTTRTGGEAISKKIAINDRSTFYDKEFKKFMLTCEQNLKSVDGSNKNDLLYVEYTDSDNGLDIVFIDGNNVKSMNFKINREEGEWRIAIKSAWDYRAYGFRYVNQGQWRYGRHSDWAEMFILPKGDSKKSFEYIDNLFKNFKDKNDKEDKSETMSAAEKWVKKGLPCTYRSGIWNKGKLISKSEAEKLFYSGKYSWGKGYHELKWETLNGKRTLAFIAASASDMW